MEEKAIPKNSSHHLQYVSDTVEENVVSKNSSRLYVSHIVEEAVISGEKLISMHPTTVKEYTPHCGGEAYVLE